MADLLYLPSASSGLLPPGDGATKVGLIVRRRSDGSFRMIEPLGHAHGVKVTWPKVTLHGGVPFGDELRRCAAHVAGVQIERPRALGLHLSTSNSTTSYYVAIGDENQSVAPLAKGKAHWVHPDLVAVRLGKSPNAASRERDLIAFQSAGSAEILRARLPFRALEVLHERGFERLRLLSVFAPSGMTCRSFIVPEGLARRTDGGELASEAQRLWRAAESASPGTVPPPELLPYFAPASDDDWNCNWSGMVEFDEAERLADHFVSKFPAFAFAGWGQDTNYRHWYARAVRHSGWSGWILSGWDGHRVLFPGGEGGALTPP